MAVQLRKPQQRHSMNKTDPTKLDEKTAPAEEAVEHKIVPKKKKQKRVVASGLVHIQATFNNTIVTVSDPKGAVLTTASAGSSGFKGSKKGTAFAAQVAAEKAINAAKSAYGLTKADVRVKGIGLGREAAIRTLSNAGVAVENIYDVTGVAHGGVRPKKARRV